MCAGFCKNAHWFLKAVHMNVYVMGRAQERDGILGLPFTNGVTLGKSVKGPHC